jgi:hypothetical protein
MAPVDAYLAACAQTSGAYHSTAAGWVCWLRVGVYVECLAGSRPAGTAPSQQPAGFGCWLANTFVVSASAAAPDACDVSAGQRVLEQLPTFSVGCTVLACSLLASPELLRELFVRSDECWTSLEARAGLHS